MYQRTRANDNVIPKVLRPGVLWFLRNLNDPDFHPVQEVSHLPVVSFITDNGEAISESQCFKGLSTQ